jgi:cell division ATPase MinD
MVRIIDVCSGKGGVGKTVVASNLGVALQKMNQKTVVIDFNFTTSHLSLYFGIYSHPITLNHVLRNEASIEDAIYSHYSGLKIIPGSLRLKDIVSVDAKDLRDMLKKTFSDYNIILLDSAPGLGREALMSLKVSDEILYVANPSIPSLVDIVKCNELVSGLENRPNPLGIVVNRVKNKGYEVKNNEIVQFTELPIVGVVPEDEKILEGTNEKTLITISDKNSPSSKAFFKIAAKIAGLEYNYSFFEKIKRAFGKGI